AVSGVTLWLKNPQQKGMLAHGPSGTGKTALAHAIANERGWELIEMNAGDFRKEASVREKLINAATQGSLFGVGKLILVDEVDGLAGRSDSGAVRAIQDLIRVSRYPVYLTCNDNWAKNIRDLKQQVKEVQFKRPRTDVLTKFLKGIVEKEGLTVKQEAILQIAQQRDFRSALLDLEALSTTPNAGLTDLESLGHRNREKNIFEALRDIFKAKDAEQARRSLDGVNISDFRDLLHWIDENLMREYEGLDLARGFDQLSKADVFMGRIRRRQDWSLLKYVIDLATIGVAQSKTKKNYGFISYRPSKYIQTRVYNRSQLMVMNGLLKKIAKHTHTSTERAHEYLPVIRAAIDHGEGKLPFEISDAENRYLQSLK
ncbi:MAG: replication factor C large subunit, partial [Candidatus Altiarchaeota archaeon]|nr:replication factor C large subunit [Candidatus Altiarchaeota archaeon]